MLLASVSCATSSEDVVATPCSSSKCLDSGGASSEVEGDSSSITDTNIGIDSDMTVTESGPIDAIFMLEDTAPAPMCDGGGSYCGAAGCKDLTKDLSSCGTCGNVCPAGANGTPTCSAGKCMFTCKTGFADCDGADPNGCEVALLTDESNCGSCAKKCLTGETCSAGACNSPAIETFESGTWPWSPWTAAGGSSTGAASGGICAHDGARGYAAPASIPVHYYRTDVTVGAAGTKLSAWIQPGSGRVYLGFGATASGAYSLVAAPNTSQLMFEREIPFGSYVAVATKSRGWASGWQKLEISFGAGGSVTGRVYAADGTTLLDTLTTTIAALTPGGVALRAFGSGTCVDTLAR